MEVDMRGLALNATEMSLKSTKPKVTEAVKFMKNMILAAANKGLFSKQFQVKSSWYSDEMNQKILSDLMYQEGVHLHFGPLEVLSDVVEVTLSWATRTDMDRMREFEKAENQYLSRSDSNQVQAKFTTEVGKGDLEVPFKLEHITNVWLTEVKNHIFSLLPFFEDLPVSSIIAF